MIQGKSVFGKRLGLGLLAGLLILSWAGAAWASEQAIPVDRHGLPQWVVKEWTDFPIEMTLETHADLDLLLQRVPVASFNREQITVDYTSAKTFRLIFSPRVTEAEAAALTEAGYDFVRVRDLEKEGRQQAEKTWASMAAKGGDTLKLGEKATYPTNAQIGATFTQMTADHPDLCRVFTWGSTVQGRDLWGLVISDDVQNTEAEPEVRLSSTMHGDEVVGMYLLYTFAQYLIEHYQEPGYEEVTNLVDNYEIHFIPLHNPDGNALHQRYNANGVDLNRNFPEPTGMLVQEIENANFMNYSLGQHFVISQNGHGGALVANYPWDYTPVLAPDDAALIKLSLEYTTYNLPMYNGNWPQGITNGYAWYETNGSVQDWSYYVTDCIDVTMEVSNIKWPSESTLDGFWADNLESLMHYTKAARYGVNGVVTAGDTGLPLDATVTVTGNAMPVHTDPTHGDYYKLLDTGTYELTFQADGYIPQTVSGVSTVWGTPTVLNVEMPPVAHGEVSGVVEDLAGNGLDAQVNIYSMPIDQYVTTVVSSTGSGGAYSANLVYGEYELRAVSSGYVTRTASVTIGATPQVVDFALPVAQEMMLFSSDFESGMTGWTGDWGLADPAEGYNSANCANDSPGGDYADNTSTFMEMAESIDLSGAMSAELTFRAKWEIEDVWDACFLEVSTNGGSTWTALSTGQTLPASGQGGQTPAGAPCFDNNQSNWVNNTVDLAPFLGQADVRLRFRLSSDTSLNYSGFFVDNFEILAVTEQGTTSPVPGADLLVAAVKAWPNPFNPQTAIQFTNPRAGQVSLAIYDVQGRLVRTLVDESLTSGSHERMWDGRTDTGSRSASGVYFARMIAGDTGAVTKLMMVK